MTLSRTLALNCHVCSFSLFSSSAFESSPFGLLSPFLFTSIAQVAEQAHCTVVASLGIQERAWLAITAVVSPRAYARKLC